MRHTLVTTLAVLTLLTATAVTADTVKAPAPAARLTAV